MNRLIIKNERTGREAVLAVYSIEEGWVQAADMKALIERLINAPVNFVITPTPTKRVKKPRRN